MAPPTGKPRKPKARTRPPEAPTAAAPEKITVRATINLPGLALGRTALADPNEPYIKQALRAGYLVRE